MHFIRLLPLFLLALQTPLPAQELPLQQWIDEAIQAGGGVVTVPPGVHVLPGGLRLHNARKVALRGMGKEEAILKLADPPASAHGKTEPPAALIAITGGSEQVEIANLTLDGGAAGPTPGVEIARDAMAGSAPSAVLIDLAAGGNSASPGGAPGGITVRDTMVHDFRGAGIRVKHAASVAMERCSIRDCGGAAIEVSASVGACTAIGNWIIRCGAGIVVADPATCRLAGNEVIETQAVAATPRPDPQRFAKDIAAFASQPAETGGIVFTGSSSIRLWKTLKEDFPDLPVLNRGFGGSVANDLIVHFDTVVGRHEPKLIVTYTGGNDINANLTTGEAFADYTRFLDLVHERLPKTRVIVTSVKIAEKRLAQMDKVHELNRRLKAWTADREWVRFLDCTSYLADADGQPIRDFYVADLLHLNEAGYAQWKKILEPVLREEWAKAVRPEKVN